MGPSKPLVTQSSAPVIVTPPGNDNYRQVRLIPLPAKHDVEGDSYAVTHRNVVWPPYVRWRSWSRKLGDSPFTNALGVKGLPGDAARLRRRSVAVFGLGAVGAVVFSQLARIGVGNLIGVDPDEYEEDSWLTQPALREHAGQPKAWIQGEAAHRVNQHIDVSTGVGFAQDVPLNLLRLVDLFIVVGDNLELLVWAGNLGAALGKIVVQGAIHPETATAFVRVFDRTNPDAVCPGCLLNTGEWNRLRNRAGCSLNTLLPQAQQPTRTNPAVCWTAAQLVVYDSLRWLLEDEPQGVLRNEELAVSLHGHRLWRTSLPRDQQCRCPHKPWKLFDVPLPAGQVTLMMLIDQFEPALSFSERVSTQVKSETPWISAAQCSACGKVNQVWRFGRIGEEVARCDCSGPLMADRAGMRSVIPRDDLSSCLDQPLSELGLGPGSAVGISNQDRWNYFFLPNNEQEEMGANQTVAKTVL